MALNPSMIAPVVYNPGDPTPRDAMGNPIQTGQTPSGSRLFQSNATPLLQTQQSQSAATPSLFARTQRPNVVSNPMRYGFGPEQSFFDSNVITNAMMEGPYGTDTMSKPPTGGGDDDGGGIGPDLVGTAAIIAALDKLFSGEGGSLIGSGAGWLADQFGITDTADSAWTDIEGKIGKFFGEGDQAVSTVDIPNLGTLTPLKDIPSDLKVGWTDGAGKVTGDVPDWATNIFDIGGQAFVFNPPGVSIPNAPPVGTLGDIPIGNIGNAPPVGTIGGGEGVGTLGGGSGGDLLDDLGGSGDLGATAGNVLGVATGAWNILNAINDPTPGNMVSAGLSIPSTIQGAAGLAGIQGASMFPATLGGSALAASAAAAAPALVFAGFDRLAQMENSGSRAGNTVLNWSPDKGWVFADHGFSDAASEEGFRNTYHETQEAAHLMNEIQKAYGLESDHDAWQQASAEKPYAIYGIGNQQRDTHKNFAGDARGWVTNVLASGMYRSSDPAVQTVLDQIRQTPNATPEQMIAALELARPGAAESMAAFDPDAAPGVHGHSGRLPTKNEVATQAGFAPPPGDINDYMWVGPTPDNPTGWQKRPKLFDPATNAGM